MFFCWIKEAARHSGCLVTLVILAKIVGLMADLYSSQCCEMGDRGVLSFILVNMGVRQACIFPP